MAELTLGGYTAATTPTSTTAVKPATNDQWTTNSNFIQGQVSGGTATPEQTEWYNKFLASGSPTSQDGMMSWLEYNQQAGIGDYDFNTVRFPDQMQTQTSPTPVSNGMAPDGGQNYGTTTPTTSPTAGTTAPQAPPTAAPMPDMGNVTSEAIPSLPTMSDMASGSTSTGTSTGGTSDAPGGWNNPYLVDGAAPDGTNPGIPIGNQNNGTAPNTYQLKPQDEVKPFTTGNAQLDEAIAGWAGEVFSGERPYSSLTASEQDAILRGMNQALAADPTQWQLATDMGFRDAYIAKYGDPQSGAAGAAGNSTNPNGTVQGEFEAEQGGAFQAIASNAAEMDPMEVAQAEAALAEENARAMTEQEYASNRLAEITAQDSPLMQLARQDGISMANSRGLTNSSLAAGASMAEMVRQASPLALQEAQQAFGMEQQNQALESARRDANANREQQISTVNAGAENNATAMEFGSEAQRRLANAEMETGVATSNAGMANDLMNQDRQRELTYNLQQLAGDQDYAKQSLASNTAKEIAIIEGNYKQLISTNDSAARVVTQLNDAIGQILSNKDIKGPEAETKIQALISATNDSLAVIGAMNNIDLSNLVLGTSGGGGQNNNVEIIDGVVYIDGQPIDFNGFAGRAASYGQ